MLVKFEYPSKFVQQYESFIKFKAFIQQYANSKSFQLVMTKFPIKWEEYINGKTKIKIDTKYTWRYYNLLNPSSESYEVFVNYPSLKKPYEASVGETCAGGDCGYGAGLGFKQINGIWYCTSKWFGSD